MCDTFLFMGEKLGLPVETEGAARDLLCCAAPPAKAGHSTRKAATLFVEVRLHLERLAERGCAGLVSEAAESACTFYARSLLVAGLDHSLRIGESWRVELWADEEDPACVVRGSAHLAKDGAPIDIYLLCSGGGGVRGV